MGRKHVGRSLGFGEPSGHGAGNRDEVQVMAVVHHWIYALHTTGFKVSAVGRRSLLIGLHSSVVVASADVYVRRHVDQVPSGRRERCQPIGLR